MIDLNDILDALKTRIVQHINDYVSDSYEKIDSKGVIVDFPDLDNMPTKTAIYIQPDSESLSRQTLCTDLSLFSIKIYILSKKDSHSSLTKKVVHYYTALTKLIMSDRTLGNKVDMSEIENADYYPALTATQTAAGMEIDLTVKRTITV